MKTNQPISTGNRKEKPPDPWRLNQYSNVVEAVEESLRKVSTATRILPRVDEKGNSDCYFAENLYAQKEEAVEKARKRIKELRELLPLLDEKIARHKRILAQISKDMRSVSYDRAKAEYATARTGQENIYKRAIRRKKRILEVLKKAEEVLRKAESKKYPGKKPEKSFQPAPIGPMGTLGSTLVPPPGPGPIGLGGAGFRPGSELKDLISLGPLTRRTG